MQTQNDSCISKVFMVTSVLPMSRVVNTHRATVGMQIFGRAIKTAEKTEFRDKICLLNKGYITTDKYRQPPVARVARGVLTFPFHAGD